MISFQDKIDDLIREYLKDNNLQSKVLKLNLILELLYKSKLGESDWYDDRFKDVIKESLKNKEVQTGINYSHILFLIMQLRSIRNDIIHLLEGYDKSIKLMKNHTENSIMEMKLNKLVEHFKEDVDIGNILDNYSDLMDMQIRRNEDTTNKEDITGNGTSSLTWHN